MRAQVGWQLGLEDPLPIPLAGLLAGASVPCHMDLSMKHPQDQATESAGVSDPMGQCLSASSEKSQAMSPGACHHIQPRGGEGHPGHLRRGG